MFRLSLVVLLLVASQSSLSSQITNDDHVNISIKATKSLYDGAPPPAIGQFISQLLWMKDIKNLLITSTQCSSDTDSQPSYFIDIAYLDEDNQPKKKTLYKPESMVIGNDGETEFHTQFFPDSKTQANTPVNTPPNNCNKTRPNIYQAFSNYRQLLDQAQAPVFATDTISATCQKLTNSKPVSSYLKNAVYRHPLEESLYFYKWARENNLLINDSEDFESSITKNCSQTSL